MTHLARAAVRSPMNCRRQRAHTSVEHWFDYGTLAERPPHNGSVTQNNMPIGHSMNCIMPKPSWRGCAQAPPRSSAKGSAATLTVKSADVASSTHATLGRKLARLLR